ncbi:DNA polymerase III subunit delta [Helicobacter canis]|uniref:DNA polymerase III subunit delta n=1 Tax=Helicobacter canis TaxID=29419 RepID=A0A377J4R9_9HELI|nr:hypothetical protein [Helicobacter canis]STO97348.1 DNA polymerase III subunit delta [Helicobacter canis]
MYKKEFDALLRTHTPRACLLYGESEYLIESTIKRLLQANALEPKVFNFGEYALAPTLDILSQSSLFGDAQCVVLKLEKKPSDKEIKALLNALAHNPDHSLIVAFFRAESKTPSQYARDCKSLGAHFKHKDIYARKASDKSIDEKKNGVIEVRFFKPSPTEAKELLSQEARALGLSIAGNLLEPLLAMQGYDVALAKAELSKLALLDRAITQQDIAQLCYGLGSVEIGELLQTLFSRGDIARAFECMLDGGLSSELSLVGELEQYFYKIFLFGVYIRLHGKPDSKEILGYALPFQEANALSQRAMKIKEGVFVEIFSLLGAWRNGIMQGQKSISLRCLIKLQALVS